MRMGVRRLVWRGHSCPRTVGLRGVPVAVMMLMVVVTMVAVLVFSFRGRGRLRHILLRPIFFPRKILLAVHPDVNLGRGNAAADDARNLQTRAYVQRRHSIFQHSRRNSGIDEGAQEHVAAHPGKTF